MRWLRAILSAAWPPRTGQTPGQMAPLPYSLDPPRPNPPVCVIGDVHGRLDLLDKLLAQIGLRPDHADARIILVGDLIDRGPDSAGVLARVHTLHRAAPERVICLMGNHERMMLDFLDDPVRHGPRWIAAGGSETLTSFGLSPWTRRQGGQAMLDLAAALRAALTPACVDWLTALPLIWQEDLLAVTHAGADPKRPLEQQSEQRLLWGTQAREAQRRHDGIWVAHGHTIVDAAAVVAGQRITVDTGAWRHGRLSAAWLDAQGLSFIEILGKK